MPADRPAFPPRHQRSRLAARLVRALAAAMLAGVLLGLGASEAGPFPLAALAAQGEPRLDESSVPVRIRLPGLGIDLPVVSSEARVRGNRRDYPLCDVAQYWTIYDLPGAPGTTWIYAHAQPGMFLPLLETAVASGEDGLIGKLVFLQLRDGRVLRYRIDEVRQHSTNRRIARRDRPNEHRLVLQTSEGPPGTVPKLQVAARLVDASLTTERAPRARPRACWQPRRSADASTGAQATPEPGAGAADGAGAASGLSLAIGGGAILLGTLVIAVYIVRRPPARPSVQRPR